MANFDRQFVTKDHEILLKYKMNQKQSVLKPPLKPKPKPTVIGINLPTQQRKPQKLIAVDLKSLMATVSKSKVNKSASVTSLSRRA